jgi:hypothetical protein
MRRIVKMKAKKIGIGVATAVAALSMFGTPASAASGDWGYAAGNMRTCTSVNLGGAPSCGFVGNGWTNGWVRVMCWKDDGWVNGTNRWFYVKAQDGRSGWMSASVVPVQPIVPHC